MSADAILKLDPMVRKLETDLAAVKEALEQADLVSAQQLLRSINRTSDYLAGDVSSIYKSEVNENGAIGPNDIFAGGAPVRQFNETEQVIDVGDRSKLLKGTIMPSRIGSIMKPHRSPGQRL